MTHDPKQTHERSILFDAEGVAGLLAGQVTQTRRPLSPQPELHPPLRPADAECLRKTGMVRGIRCPFGQIGDRLWVQETHRYWYQYEEVVEVGPDDDEVVFLDRESVRWEQDLRRGMELRHDDDNRVVSVTYLDVSTPLERDGGLHQYKKRPAIHMPKWAARIWLTITDLRLERLACLRAVDALAEGIDHYARENQLAGYYTTAYARRWNARTAKGLRFEDNPLVWVVCFDREAP